MCLFYSSPQDAASFTGNLSEGLPDAFVEASGREAQFLKRALDESSKRLTFLREKSWADE
jgi:hypothetical protein